MRCSPFTDPEAFERLALPLLLANEERYCLQVGIVSGLARRPRADAVMLAVTDGDGAPAAVVVRTPPYLFTASTLTLEQAEVVAERVVADRIAFPGVLGPVDSARALAAAVTCRTGESFELERSEGVHALHHVEDVPIPSGTPRPATLDDTERLVSLVAGFFDDTGARGDGSPTETIVRRGVEQGALHVWEHAGELVAMASYMGQTPGSRGISLVYTPPAFRRHGYATALVAHLSRTILASGKRFCSLFTNLANPTSNAIYRRIGYRRVADFASFTVGASAPLTSR